MRRHGEAQKAIQEWEREVDEEMARLIRQGTPPFDAASQARDSVSARRRSAAHGAEEPK